VSGQRGRDHGEKLALSPDGHIADTERLAAIAAEMNTGWPPLTEHQKERLALLLRRRRPDGGHDGTH
jgi:hypothetical protein